MTQANMGFKGTRYQKKAEKKVIIALEKFFLFCVPMNIQKDWKAKLESAYSYMLKYSKITVRV